LPKPGAPPAHRDESTRDGAPRIVGLMPRGSRRARKHDSFTSMNGSRPDRWRRARRDGRPGAYRVVFAGPDPTASGLQGFLVRPPLKVRLRPIALAVSLTFATASADAATLIVTDGGDGGDATTCTLRQAITSANKNAHGTSGCIDGSGSDTIVFADNLVDSTITLGGQELVIKSPLTIVGSGQVIDANHASRVMYVGSTSLSASYLTLINGAADGNSGGGLFVISSIVDLTGVSVVANVADYAAGIAVFNSSDVTLNNSTVSGNTAARKGGGVEIINGSQLSLSHSSIDGNTANRGAGVFFSFYSDLSMTQSSISGNTATSAPPLSGGGVYGYKCSTLKIVDSTVASNSSNYSGAGIVAVRCPVAVANTTIAANIASAGGGAAIYLDQSDATIVSATISANVGHDGGGVLADQSALTLANTILSANQVDAGFEATADLATYSNSTLAVQYSLLGTALNVSGLNDSAYHNVFFNDPGLGLLQDNGGATMTMAPLPDSPVIDIGSAMLAQYDGQYLQSDQRPGFPRVVGTAIDIGAIEYQPDRIFSGAFERLP
jgi:hypothetical protein